MGLIEKFDYIIFDIRCGLHSGFRVCDIVWYVFIWCPFSLCNTRYYRWYEKRKKGAGCVRCPACVLLKRKAPKIKPCVCSKAVTGSYLRLSNWKNWIRSNNLKKITSISGRYKTEIYLHNFRKSTMCQSSEAKAIEKYLLQR